MTKDEQVLRKAKSIPNQKKWSKIKGENSWTLFKVISEFVHGFEVMNNIKPCI